MKNKRNKLFHALAGKDHKTVNKLTSGIWGRFLLNSKNADGLTPLMVACKTDDEVSVILLLSKGVKVDLYSPDNMTSLWFAFLNKNISIAKILLVYQASIISALAPFYNKKDDIEEIYDNEKLIKKQIIDFDQFIFFILKSSAYDDRFSYIKMKYDIYIKNGNSLYKEKNYKSAVWSFVGAFHHAMDRSSKFHAAINIALCYNNIYKHSNALFYIEYGLGLLKEIEFADGGLSEKNYKGKATLLSLQGSCFYFKNEFNKATESYDLSLECCAKYKNSSDLRYLVYLFKGNLYKAQKDYNNTLQAFHKAHEIMFSINPGLIELDQLGLDIIFCQIKLEKLAIAEITLNIIENRYKNKRNLGIWSHINYTRACLCEAKYNVTGDVEYLKQSKWYLEESIKESDQLHYRYYITDKDEFKRLQNYHVADTHLLIEVNVRLYDNLNDSQYLYDSIESIENKKSLAVLYLKGRRADLITAENINGYLINNPDAAFIYFYPSETCSFIFIIVKNNIHLIKTDYSRIKIKAIAEELQKLSIDLTNIKNERQYNRALAKFLQDLYSSVKPDFDRILSGFTNLVFVPYGYYNTLPLHVIHDNNKSGKIDYLMDRFDIVYTYSISSYISNSKSLPKTRKVKIIKGNLSDQDKIYEIKDLIELQSNGHISIEGPFEAHAENITSFFNNILSEGMAVHFLGHSSNQKGFALNVDKKNKKSTKLYEIFPVESVIKFINLNKRCLIVLNSCQTGLPVINYDPFPDVDIGIDDFIALETAFIGKGIVVSTFIELNENLCAAVLSRFYNEYFVHDNSISDSLKNAVMYFRDKNIQKGNTRLISQIQATIKKSGEDFANKSYNASLKKITLAEWSAFKITI